MTIKRDKLTSKVQLVSLGSKTSYRAIFKRFITKIDDLNHSYNKNSITSKYSNQHNENFSIRSHKKDEPQPEDTKKLNAVETNHNILKRKNYQM